MSQTSLNSTGVASSGALSLQSNGTTEAIGISTGQVATFAQNPILTSGTANGVGYLNGSKVFTTGSALTFDGTQLGIGVASPTQLIDGTATNPRLKLTATSTGYSAAQFANSSGNSYFGRDNSTGSFFGIANGTVVYSSSSDPIGFFLGASEQMRLTSTGLGIGTSSISTKLAVVGTASAIYSSATGSGSYGVYGSHTRGQYGMLGYYDGTNDWGIYSNSNGYIAGNLGLGVTPSAWISGNKVLDIGTRTALWSGGAGQPNLGYNCYVNSGGSFIYKATAAANYYTQDGTHAWFNAASGTAGNPITFTQAMTLDASGRLQIGTTTAAGALTVVAPAGVSYGSFDAPTANNAYCSYRYNGSNYAFLGQGSSLFSGGSTTDFGFTTSGATNIVLGTNNTERARIDSSGNLLVGATSVNGLGGTTFAPNYALWNSSNNNTTRLFFQYNSSTIGSVTTTSTTTTYNITSDYRLKNIIGPVLDQGERIDAIEPVEYEWKVNGEKTRGFLAHKFQEVYPNSVTGEKDAVDENGNPVYQQMQSSTQEAMADIFAELKSLRARVKQLEGN